MHDVQRPIAEAAHEQIKADELSFEDMEALVCSIPGTDWTSNGRIVMTSTLPFSNSPLFRHWMEIVIFPSLARQDGTLQRPKR